MKIDEHIKNLEEYCEDDIKFRSQTAEEEKSDFDIFCDNHIADIKAVIQELKNTQSDLYEANNRIADLMNIIDERDKIIDLMANEIYIEHNPHFNTVEDVKKYFEERCK
jgi:hypothetical protein